MILDAADIGPDPHTGKTITAHKRVKEIVEAAKLADEAGNIPISVIGAATCCC